MNLLQDIIQIEMNFSIKLIFFSAILEGIGMTENTTFIEEEIDQQVGI